MLLIEINEFNPELMAKAAAELGLKNLQKLLRFQLSETFTNDKKERYGLDPWVQWVSIHTGKTSDVHGIRHLGDVEDLKYPQIWEELSQLGYSSGVWGAMNAKRGKADKCAFFFPDPWTFSEPAYPMELNNLLEFPRYYSKNYCDLKFMAVSRGLLKFFHFCFRPRVLLQLIQIAPTFIVSILSRGFPNYLLFSLFDLLSAKLFSMYFKKEKPDFSIIFLNSVAHLQHHKWTSEISMSNEMIKGFTLLDKTIGIILEVTQENAPIIVSNAFTQRCTYNNNEFLYRQINPENFLDVAGIKYLSLEQMMTNDAHVFFDSEEDALLAVTALKGANINGEKIFDVDYSRKHTLRLFYQISCWTHFDKYSVLSINKVELNFYEQFEIIAHRSGSHIQNGHVYFSKLPLPSKMYNHELFHHILNYYSSK
jgi:hypothetical protein